MADYHYDDPPLPERDVPRAKHVPAKKGVGCGFWLLVAGMVFFAFTSLVLLIAVIAVAPSHVTSASGNLPYIETSVSGDKRSSQKILLVPIHGIILDAPIGGFGPPRPGLVTQVLAILKRAREDSDIKAVLLDIDSPGGGITDSDILYNEIRKFKAETGKPVVALLRDIAASGGYYVAAASDRIIAHRTTLTGSIGVIMPHWNIEDLLDKIGVRSDPIKSGKYKDIGSMYRQTTDEELKMLQDMIDEYQSLFVTVIHQGFTNRSINLTRKKLETWCDGRIMTGGQAKKLGFVDQLGYYDDAVKAVAGLAGITSGNEHVITFQRRPGFLDALLMQTQTPRPDTVKLEIEGMPKLDTPKFMYLWTINANTTNN